MFNKLVNMATKLASDGERLFNRTINQTLFENVVCAGYLIASADGDFDGEERKALVSLIKKDLSEFSTDDVIAIINRCDNRIQFDKTLGLQEILDEISMSAKDEADAKQIMAVCAFIGASDGDYDKDEKMVARSICYALKLTPAHYNL